jgi:hypothetical protein
MSLELTIAENTRAVNQLIAILRALNPVPAEEISASMQLRPETKAKHPKKEAAPAPVGEPVEEQPAQSPETGATSASETEAAADPVEPLTYAQVQAATLAAVKAGKRDQVVKILEAYGVKRADQLSEEIWPEYLGKIEAL